MFMLSTVRWLTTQMTKPKTADDEDRDHLDELEDGAGCVEIWEKLSEQRSKSDD